MDSENLFKADKVSGIEGNIFALSTLLEVIRQNNTRHLFKFPFYALSFDDKTQRADEWVDDRKYGIVVEEILTYSKNNGTAYFQDTKNGVIAKARDIHAVASELVPKLSGLSNFELAQEYAEFVNLYTSSFGLGAVTFLYESILSEKLNSSLSKRYPNATDIINFHLHSSYKSFMIEDEERLREIKNEKNEAKRATLVTQYQKDFFFIKSNFSYTSPLDERKILALAESVNENTPVEKKSVSVDVKLTQEEQIIVDIFKETEVIRDQRKKLNYIGNFVLFRFLEEACRRSYTAISVARRMFWNEFADFVFTPELLIKRLENRKVASVVLDSIATHYFDFNAIESRVALDESIQECRGTTACKGKVHAKANIILTTADFPKFKKGDVLITEMTRPEFVPLMKEASAIVTDEGGLTCHAAIISRELGTPCIVGTKIATRIFKDGDMVEVDADKGIVRILK
ncbi:MAG: hypothetical protein RIT04_494 [Candidatus Parcubacteria bacterium]|jgi:phosphohistidine swiveling domain-containing protein